MNSVKLTISSLRRCCFLAVTRRGQFGQNGAGELGEWSGVMNG